MGNKSKNIKSSTAQLLFFPPTLSCSIILIEISQFLVSLLDFPFSAVYRGSSGVFLCCFHNFPPSHFSAVWSSAERKWVYLWTRWRAGANGEKQGKKGEKTENWVNLEQQKLENTTQRSVAFHRSILHCFSVVSQHHLVWKSPSRLCEFCIVSAHPFELSMESSATIEFSKLLKMHRHTQFELFLMSILQFHHVEFGISPIEMEEWKIFLFLRMPFLISSQLWNFRAFTRDTNASQTSNGNSKKTLRWQNWQHQNGRRHVSQKVNTKI